MSEPRFLEDGFVLVDAVGELKHQSIAKFAGLVDLRDEVRIATAESAQRVRSQASDRRDGDVIEQV